MITRFFRRLPALIFFVGLPFLLTNCKKDSDPEPGVPVVTSFTPEHGLPGASVTIAGENFATSAEDNTVMINGVQASISSASATGLVIIVPEGSSTGKISVTVNDLEGESDNDFEVLIDIPRSGLVAFYPFSGNANDVSGNNLNGTVTGSTLTSDRFGSASHAYDFDGASNKVSMGNPALLQISNKITVACWFNTDNVSTTKAILTKIFFDPDQGGNPALGYWLYQSNTGGGTPYATLAVYSTAGLGVSSYVGESLTAGTWYFATLTIDDKDYKYYQDGVFKNGATLSNNALDDGTKGDLVVGAYGGGFFFDGKVDDIAIYNRALTAEEVTQLYNQTVTKY